MKIGVPKETLRHEHRVGLTPFAVSRLTSLGHEIYIERGAGKDAHFAEEDFTRAGAQIVYSVEEAYGRAELVCRVGSLSADEVKLLPPEAVVCGFHHLAVATRDAVQQLVDRRVTMIGYEIIHDAAGNRPVLASLSEIAGHMLIQTAGHLLQHEQGGRGIILGGVPGVPPATVVILGAGIVGRAACAHFTAAGAHVILMDQDLEKLRDAMHHTCHNAVTVVSNPRNLERFTPIADVLVGAILIPGARAPFLVTEEMVRKMKPGSVILDVSIDQGGCVETSRPTTPDHPTFQVHGVTHYCVPNMTANAPRAASRSLALAALPHITRLAEDGVEAALKADPGLAKGVYLYRGKMVNQVAAEGLGLPAAHLPDLLS